jgi:hypothetical protein
VHVCGILLNWREQGSAGVNLRAARRAGLPEAQQRRLTVMRACQRRRYQRMKLDELNRLERRLGLPQTAGFCEEAVRIVPVPLQTPQVCEVFTCSQPAMASYRLEVPGCNSALRFPLCGEHARANLGF